MLLKEEGFDSFSECNVIWWSHVYTSELRKFIKCFFSADEKSPKIREKSVITVIVLIKKTYAPLLDIGF